jgi:hypothetical protein
MLTANSIRQDALALTGTTNLRTNGGNSGLSIMKCLSITGTGTLDLNDNDLILDYSGASPIAAYEALVASGYNGVGDWQGDGITSSVAAIDGNYVLAVADNAALAAPFGTAQGGALFSGVDVDLTTVLVKFTHRVDLNLDGLVTDTDGIIFSTNYEPGAAAMWSIGDLDYDGVFSDNDVILFGTFYDTGLQHLPEPASAAFIAAAGWLGLSLRRLQKSRLR